MFQILPATSVMLLLHTHVVSQTLTPIPNGMCWETNNTLYGNESVNTLEMGSCGFNNTLCSYSQGCSDTGTSWTKHEDYVRYIGNGGVQSKFSVLLSPVLDIQYVSCLTYDFIAEHPGRLSVFLANHSHVTNIINEDPMNIDTFKQGSTSLPPSVSLIGFRARDCLTEKPVKLKDVKIQDGDCSSLICDFSGESFCGWHQINWTLTPSTFVQDWTARMNITANIASMVTGNFTRVNSSSGQGTMTSFMTRANDPHCLNFSYIVGGVDAKLDIHIQFLDKPENIHCSVSSNESYPFHLERGYVHVSTKIPYNVSFVGSGCDSDKCIVGIDDFTTLKGNCSTTLNCYVNPSILVAANWTSGMNNVTDNLETTQNLDESTLEGTKASERADFEEDGNNSVIIGAIVGSVIAILAVLAIVIIVLVSWKKRTRAQKGSDSNETHLKKNCQQQQPNNAKDLYTDDNHFENIKTLDSARLDKTVTTDISTKRNNRPYAPIEVDQHDSHAYDLIPESGISRKIPLEECDHYDLAGTTNEFNMHYLSNGNNSSNFNRLKQAERPDYSTAQISRQNHGVTDETVVEYNRIDLGNHTSKKESVSATLNARDMLQSKVPAYSSVQKSSHIPKVTNETFDEYNRIDLENHTSKKESVSATLNARDMLQSKVPAYSSVQKSSHIPKVTNETVDEYNRIDKERHIYGKEPTSNVYNKLKSPLCDIPSNCNNESLKPVMDMPQDDYNKLDYKQNHRNQPANDKGDEKEDECSPTLKAYSSVGNHTDTYARVHSDKKDNIIASDYDHIV